LQRVSTIFVSRTFQEEEPAADLAAWFSAANRRCWEAIKEQRMRFFFDTQV
jgi:hypothetical protein